MSPQEAMQFLIDFLDSSPDDDHLCNAALDIAEPLIDWHWRVIGEEFVALMTRRADLRKMVSCCMFDPSVPDEFAERMYALVRPEDDIGHQPA